MKKFVFIILLFMSCVVYANDTIRVDNTKIREVVEHKTTNSKGNLTIKYYFVYDNELISTSKTVVDKYKLSKQYKVNCPLAIIVRGKNKRITLY